MHCILCTIKIVHRKTLKYAQINPNQSLPTFYKLQKFKFQNCAPRLIQKPARKARKNFFSESSLSLVKTEAKFTKTRAAKKSPHECAPTKIKSEPKGKKKEERKLKRKRQALARKENKAQRSGVKSRLENIAPRADERRDARAGW